MIRCATPALGTRWPHHSTVHGPSPRRRLPPARAAASWGETTRALGRRPWGGKLICLPLFPHSILPDLASGVRHGCGTALPLEGVKGRQVIVGGGSQRCEWLREPQGVAAHSVACCSAFCRILEMHKGASLAVPLERRKRPESSVTGQLGDTFISHPATGCSEQTQQGLGVWESAGTPK